MIESEKKLILQIIARLARVQNAASDLFFQRRVAEQAQLILETYIQYRLDAKYRRNIVQVLKSTSQVLEDIDHIGLCPDEIGLSLAQERILCLIRELLSERPAPVSIVNQVSPSAKIIDARPAARPAQLNPTATRILDFVRKAPERRTKEIIEEFSALSGRTVKRSLKELSREGLIIRKTDNKAVYYSAA